MCGWGPYAREASVWGGMLLVLWCYKHVLNCLTNQHLDRLANGWFCLRGRFPEPLAPYKALRRPSGQRRIEALLSADHPHRLIATHRVCIVNGSV